jgi:hypothetical protein
LDPFAAFVLEDAAPTNAHRQIVFVFAGNLAGFAASAFCNVNVKSKLFRHGSSP